MMAKFASASRTAGDEPVSSRRNFVAAGVTAAAAGAAGATKAQTPATARFLNPSGMATPSTYSQVVEGADHIAPFILRAKPRLMRAASFRTASAHRRSS